MKRTTGMLPLLLLITCIVAMIYFKNMAQCHAKWDVASYGFWSGCMVQVNDLYVPERNVQVITWVNE